MNPVTVDKVRELQLLQADIPGGRGLAGWPGHRQAGSSDDLTAVEGYDEPLAALTCCTWS